MKDQELFDLCKEVYERTGWNDTPTLYLTINKGLKSEYMQLVVADEDEDADDFNDSTPNYTSDYLLEKLPYMIKGNVLNVFANNKYWCALYGRTTTAQKTGQFGEADTPLKALLKLVIALHEAGDVS